MELVASGKYFSLRSIIVRLIYLTLLSVQETYFISVFPNLFLSGETFKVQKWVTLPRQKMPSIPKSCSKSLKFGWSSDVRVFLIHVPQFHPFFRLPEFCARVDNSAKLLSNQI